MNLARTIVRAIVRWWARRKETVAYWRWHNSLYPGGSTQSPEWRTLRLMVIRRDRYRCRTCGQSGRFPHRQRGMPFVPSGPSVGLHVDHIVPLSKGGTNDVTNLQTLCKRCHELKTGRRLAGATMTVCPYLGAATLTHPGDPDDGEKKKYAPPRTTHAPAALPTPA